MTSYSKDKVIEAAIKIFSDKGYDRASMREIAQAAGLTKPMIYYHFKNKQDLYRHLLAMHMEPFCAHLQEILYTREDLKEILCKIIDLYEETFRTNPGMFQVIQREVTGGGQFMGFLTEKYFSLIHSQIAIFLEKGAKQGIFRHSLNYYLGSLTLVAILMFHFSQSSVLRKLSQYLDEELLSRDVIRAHILELFTN
jgi:AcrR family transcriptional regulator